MSLILLDESLLVLIFICCPLTLLLFAGIILAIRSGLPAKFPTFSVKVIRGGSHGGPDRVRYVAGGNVLEFEAIVRPRRSIDVCLPMKLPEEDLRHMVADLVQGLEKLRYKYLIYRKCEARVISEEERAEAAAELRQIGIDVDKPPDQAKLLQTLVEIDRSALAGEAFVTVPRLLSLIDKATKSKEGIEILAGRGAEACAGDIKWRLLMHQAERVRDRHRVERQ